MLYSAHFVIRLIDLKSNFAQATTWWNWLSFYYSNNDKKKLHYFVAAFAGNSIYIEIGGERMGEIYS